MRLLTVPNWSFGRNRDLHIRFGTLLESSPVEVHYFQGDPDHNRTVTAFSGEPDAVHRTLMSLCEVAFEAIDLNRHNGVHPRIGALDVCPFVASPADEPLALEIAELVADQIASDYQIPVYLYEKSEHGNHEADLPSLRRGGFGGLLGKRLRPDYGPTEAHPRLGVTVVGVRGPLIAMNVDLRSEDLALAKRFAKEIRDLRTEGDPRFLGVRALGLLLSSRRETQVSMNLTLPDLTSVDPIVQWVRERALKFKVAVARTELIGVIRPQDLPGATSLPIRDGQVVSL